jgi:citrate lyase beta subunit
MTGADPAPVRAAARVVADEIVLDLRSVPESGKSDLVRLAVADAITGLSWRAPAILVALNEAGTRWFREDIVQLVMLVGAGVERVVVPGVRDPDQLLAAVELLDEIEHEFPVRRPVAVAARVGCVHRPGELSALVAALHGISPRLDSLILDSSGPEADETRAYREAAELAHAHGWTVFAGPVAGSAARIRTRARRAWQAGLDGTWASDRHQLTALRALQCQLDRRSS